VVDERVPGPGVPEPGDQGQAPEPEQGQAPEPEQQRSAGQGEAGAGQGEDRQPAADLDGGSGDGDREPAMTQVMLRRAPRYRAFVLTGALAGLIAAAVVVFGRFLPLHQGYDAGTVFLYFALAFVLFGGLFGAVAAIFAERRR
jgi:hypothetical protein